MRSLIGALMLLALPAAAQTICDPIDPLPTKLLRLNPGITRMLRYTVLASQHRLLGLASYYSTSLDGTLTANGERYHNKRLSAAHLTLPLGCWVEVRSVATGKSVRLRVNDRGPYVKKFCIDLSQAAARAIGVDVAEDRTVLIRIVGLPGEDPLPPSAFEPAATAMAEATPAAR